MEDNPFSRGTSPIPSMNSVCTNFDSITEDKPKDFSIRTPFTGKMFSSSDRHESDKGFSIFKDFVEHEKREFCSKAVESMSEEEFREARSMFEKEFRRGESMSEEEFREVLRKELLEKLSQGHEEKEAPSNGFGSSGMFNPIRADEVCFKEKKHEEKERPMWEPHHNSAMFQRYLDEIAASEKKKAKDEKKPEYRSGETCVDCAASGADSKRLKSSIDDQYRCSSPYESTPSCTFLHMESLVKESLNTFESISKFTEASLLRSRRQKAVLRKKVESLNTSMLSLARIRTQLLKQNKDLLEKVSKLEYMDTVVRATAYETKILELEDVLNGTRGDLDKVSSRLSNTRQALKLTQRDLERARSDCGTSEQLVEHATTQIHNNTKIVESLNLCVSQLQESLQGVQESNRNLEERLGKGICCICTVGMSIVLYEECDHLCVCEECSIKLGDGDPACPICRTEGGRKKIHIV